MRIKFIGEITEQTKKLYEDMLDVLERKRALERIPVTLHSGISLELSTGEQLVPFRHRVLTSYINQHK